MAKSQETYNKKEKEKKKLEKRKEKEQRKEERKAQSKEGGSWEDMIAYVDENGNILNVSTVGNKIGHGLEEEAVRVVSKMAKWTPGQVKGKNVKTCRTLPINYKLEG